MWRRILPDQSGPARGIINTNQLFFKGGHLTLLYLMGSFLMELRHSILYYGLLLLCIASLCTSNEMLCQLTYFMLLLHWYVSFKISFAVLNMRMCAALTMLNTMCLSLQTFNSASWRWNKIVEYIITTSTNCHVQHS